MGLALPHGGHLTHGHQTETKKISSSALYFESHPYFVNVETGYIDYEGLAKQAAEVKPALIICGASAYPRDFDYKKFREIADSVGALLMADVAHYSGLVCSKLMSSPFDHCDVVTSTTHKSLRGPRSGIIFFRKKYEDAINFAVFPQCQGGPHNNVIGALAVQLKEVNSPEFRAYSAQVIKNAQACAAELQKKGEKIVTDGTDTHLVMWDVRPHGLTGNKVEKVYDYMHITVNKNSIIGDKSALVPGGVRLGTPAMTTRGLVEKDWEQVVTFLLKGVEIAKRITEASGKNLKDFLAALDKDEEVLKVGEEVKAWSKQFSIPGV